MELAAFWNFIQRSQQGTEDCSEQAGCLARLLSALELEGILAFDRHFRDRMRESYRNDLWAVAYIINGGCSDDCFDYFRGWVIAQGRDFFEAVMKSPEHAATRVGEGGDVECEDILYVTAEVYESKTGKELPLRLDEPPFTLQGDGWTEDDLDRLFPRLCKRFFA